ncbi:GAF domain-containing protein [Burkholderia ubonensis]|uniref:GAF domain-containing protein n=1 Tax=Burkholderia ubonensis subsp. mesacidophila TaxID=265293 RepID=A0A2A4FEZ0_9BURK|nr:GAF domain-containing protein [Burkholderia ubonensis]PCE31240.1 hypothetical protein BZL54_16545 [Burkholderia ubonensis subsp. mesacidophila]
MSTANDWFKHVEDAFQRTVGHRLFTAMRIVASGGEAERIYSNDERAYPLTGRKPMLRDAWYTRVVVEQRSFLARQPDEFRAFYADHEKIVAMGLGSAINVPVIHDGHVLGTINLLDRCHAYAESVLPTCERLAHGAVQAFLSAAAGSGK